MLTQTVFYIVFAGQIFLISYYFPNRILGRMWTVLEQYPPSEYPRLYPRSVESHRAACRRFELANRLVFVLGVAILLTMIFVVDHATFADDGFISEAWPAAYGGIQFIPFIMLELSEYSQFKSMRNASVSTTRKAELRPRRFTDFASPALLFSAVALFFGAIVFDFYLDDFTFSMASDATQRAIVLTFTNLFMAVVSAWGIYGRKLNPHQSIADRSKQMAAGVTSMLYTSIALSIFFMTLALDDAFSLGGLDAILMSLYFQGIMVVSMGHILRSLRLEDIDFSVYRGEPSAS